MNGKLIKVIGVAASAVGVLASLVGSWASDKQLDAKITEKVAEALANNSNEGA